MRFVGLVRFVERVHYKIPVEFHSQGKTVNILKGHNSL
ncbi:hypothetical protein PU02_0338 [Bartonella ancashensis]|uniref:Uncharacterized protein n=1 Tax=Bartonella ancashensis TaxID=1318743 RepID=A0A0M4LIZ5_9HYPH|nr:hypothetical protein PU02_0338 [Bartonella ancashensis]